MRLAHQIDRSKMNTLMHQSHSSHATGISATRNREQALRTTFSHPLLSPSMNLSHLVLIIFLFASLITASLRPRKRKGEKVYKEVLRWLVSNGVDPSIKKLVMDYVVPFQIVQLHQAKLLREENILTHGRLVLPKMVAMGHSQMAIVKDDEVHVIKSGASSEKLRLSRRDATPTAMNYADSERDILVVAFNDGKVLGYTKKKADFEVDVGRPLHVLTLSKDILCGASHDGVGVWDVQKGELLGSYPFDERVDNLHVQGRTIFIHTTSFKNYVLREGAESPELLDTGCRTISYGMELGERLCYGTQKEVTYYPSLDAPEYSWRIQNSGIVGARLVPDEKVAMIITTAGIDLMGTEDHETVYASTFGGAFFSTRVVDAEVMKSHRGGAVMLRERGESGRGAVVYRTVSRKKTIKRVIGEGNPSMCIIL